MANKITEKLSEIKKSQGWLARQSGLADSYVNRICRGFIDPRISTAFKITKALKCQIEDLWKPV